MNKILSKFYTQKKINTIKEDVKNDKPKFYEQFFNEPNLKESTKCFTNEFKSEWARGYNLYIEGFETRGDLMERPMGRGL